MQNRPAPIVGVMKFSTISSKDKGSFISSREKTWEEHVKSILDPNRLQFRLKFLTEVTLPQLANQSLKPDAEWFSFIVITSSLLPDNIRSALHSSARKYPWLRVVERGEDDWIGVAKWTKESLSQMDYHGTKVPFLSFRLDDDDTLSEQYLESAQAHICPANIDKILSFSRGAKILWDTNSFAVRNYQEEYRPFIAIGLGAIAAFNFEAKDFASNIQTVFVGGNHYQIKESYSVIEDETPRMFIWSHHSSQDTHGRFSSVEFRGEWVEVPSDIEEKLLHFPPLLKFVQ